MPETTSSEQNKPMDSKLEKPVTLPNNMCDFGTLQVSNLALHVEHIKSYFQSKIAHFQSGQIAKHAAKWQELTSNPEVLDSVHGLHIDFSTEPNQTYPCQTTLSAEVDKEIAKLLTKGVIQKSHHEPEEYISPIFLKQKKDGSYRMILNLKRLNVHVRYLHLKMESIQSAIKLLTSNCYMAKLDLKDAYYSVCP